MKQQGVEGFTWDSDAEEWAAWAIGCWEHDPPRTERLRDRHVAMTREYWNEAATEARHSPAQRDLTPKPYSPTTRRKTPSYGAAIGVCGLVLVAVAFWIWG